jgi:WD40 repeat protein
MPDDSLLLGQLAEEFTQRVRDGQLPNIDDYAAKHPALAERIRALFPTLLFLEGMARAQPALDQEAATLAFDKATRALAPGQMFNHYRIEREVGRGGMGVVYEAVHMPLEKRVALKVLPPMTGEDAAQLERFLREARTAAGLHHTNIVPVFDIGQCGGMPYYAMQFIAGRGLDAILLLLPHAETAAGAGSSLVTAGRARCSDYYRQVAALGIQAAEGLAHAHQRGVIHRDIKPSNLLLDEQGVLWITDFGLARRAADPALTHSNALVGTPRYMSPEQAEAARRPVDHRTDVYSLGATLYEMVTRQPAFGGKTPVDVLLQVIEREPVTPRRRDPAVPRDLETIIVKAMAKRPEDRYQTAAELGDDLRRFQRGEPVKARRIGPLRRLVRWGRRNPVVASLTGAVIAVLVVGTAVSTWFALDAAEQARLATDETNAARLAEEQTKDLLCRSFVDQAQNALASDLSDRRWQALELLQKAEKLRVRARPEGMVASHLPTAVEIRRLATTALLTPGCRVVEECQLRTLMLLTPDAKWGVFLEKDSTPQKLWRIRMADKERVLLAEVHFGPELADRKAHGFDAIALSDDGRWWARADKSGITVFDLVSGETTTWPLPQVKHRERQQVDLRANHLAFTPDGTKLLGFFNRQTTGQIRAWRIQSKDPSVLLVEEPCVYCAPWLSPDGKSLIYGQFRDATMRLDVCLKDLQSNKTAILEGFQPPKDHFRTIAWSPDGRLFAYYAAKGKGKDEKAVIAIWAIDDNRIVAEFDVPDWASHLEWSPDNRRLAVATMMGLTIYRIPDGKKTCEIRLGLLISRDHEGVLRWSQDGRRIYYGSAILPLTVLEVDWDTPESDLVTAPDIPSTCAFSPDGRWQAIGLQGRNKPVWIIERATGVKKPLLAVRCLYSLLFALRPSPLPLAVLDTLPAYLFPQVRWLRFSPDSQRLAVLAAGSPLVVFDTKDWRPVPCKETFPSWPEAEFSDNGDLLLLDHGSLRNAMTGVTELLGNADNKVLSAKRRGYEFGRAAGKLVLIDHISEGWHTQHRGEPATLKLRDFATKTQLAAWQEAQDWRLHWPYVLSPNGHLLAAGTVQFMRGFPWGVRLFSTNPDTTPVFLLTVDVVKCIAFSPDSSLVALGCCDGTIQIFSVPDGEERVRWKPTARTNYEWSRWVPEPSRDPELVFTPDGNALAWCDGQHANVRILELGKLKQRLAECGLAW